MKQFSLFAWTHVALLIVVTQSYLIIRNIFQGLIWYLTVSYFDPFVLKILKFVPSARFIVPVSMIVCNDVMAYMFGFFFGRTPLIKLSPKKTWEGFIGGGFATVVFGLGVSFFFPFFFKSYLRSNLICFYSIIDFLSFVPISLLYLPYRV